MDGKPRMGAGNKELSVGDRVVLHGTVVAFENNTAFIDPSCDRIKAEVGYVLKPGPQSFWYSAFVEHVEKV